MKKHLISIVFSLVLSLVIFAFGRIPPCQGNDTTISSDKVADTLVVSEEPRTDKPSEVQNDRVAFTIEDNEISDESREQNEEVAKPRDKFRETLEKLTCQWEVSDTDIHDDLSGVCYSIYFDYTTFGPNDETVVKIEVVSRKILECIKKGELDPTNKVHWHEDMRPVYVASIPALHADMCLGTKGMTDDQKVNCPDPTLAYAYLRRTAEEWDPDMRCDLVYSLEWKHWPNDYPRKNDFYDAGWEREKWESWRRKCRFTD